MSTESEGGESQHIVGTKPANIAELTVRSVIVGIVVAGIMGASYPYIVLKLGFGPNVSVVAAFFGFIFVAGPTYLLQRFGRKNVTPYNRWENNIVQTAGTSASQTAFMCILLAAFDMLRANPKAGFTLELTELQSFMWLTFAGLLGVLLAVPLRQHYIVDEKLTFADGVAAGETLIVLDSTGDQGRKAAKMMGIGTLLSGLSFALREEGLLWKAFFSNAIPDSLNVANKTLQKTGTGFSLSLLALGSGALVGPRINTSMMIGATLSWVVAPLVLLPLGLIIDPNNNQVMDASNFKRLHILFWVMWPGVGILIAGGLTALFLKWQVLMRSFKALTGAKAATGDLSLRTIAIGVVLASTGLVIVQYVNLGVAPWITLLAILFSLPLMLIGLRALGETNWGPISTLSNVMQGIFAAIIPGSMPANQALTANMVASGTTGTIATDSEAIMQDYKAGHMIGSTPGKLTIMQLVGVPIGAAAVAWMYPFLAKTYGIVGDNAKLASPASARWAGFAVILKAGSEALPRYAVHALVVFSILGVIFTILEGNKKLKKWVPSPTGVGIGMLVPFAVVSTMFIGGLLGYWWEKSDKKSSDVYAAPLASGLIAGEAIVAVIVPLLIALGLIPND